ncbi:hypothetical protein AB0C33_30960 [Nonomuraea sp. NPDC048881]|uniref:hypothetical protein n=1 Tax=Nonomuraea sp. NPDC048881 TaxID=3155030 RepID=UPI0033E1CE48
MTTFAARVPAPAPYVRRRSRSRSWWLLAIGWVAQVALRLWLFRQHAGPVANPDETGYLIAARWLAGGPGADLTGFTFYQGGYPLLLTPVFWFTQDPVVAYRLVVAVGSMVAAGAFPLAYLLLRRLGTGPRAAMAAAFAGGLSPSLLLFSGLALADAVLPTLVLAWLVALHDLVARGSVRAGGLGGGLAGYAMAVHLRGTVVLAVTLLAMAGMLIAGRRGPAGRFFARRRGVAAGTATAGLSIARRRGAAAGLVAAVVAAGAATALNRVLSAALYPGGARDLSGLLAERVSGLDGQAWALAGAAGQLWYLIAGTWGLAGVGLAGAVAVVARRSAPGPRRVLAAVLLATTLGIAYASSAALPDEHRIGNYAYGRYLACVALAWTLAGLLVLARAGRGAVVRHALAAAGLLAATGGVVVRYAGDRLHRYAFIAFDFPEVIFLSRVRDSFDLVATSLAALALLAGLVAAALLTARRGWPAVLAVLAAVNLVFAADLAPKSAPAAGPDWLPVLTGPGRVAVDRRVMWNVRAVLAYRVSWTEAELYDGTPPAGVCTAVVPPGSGPAHAGWAATGAGGTRQGWTTWVSDRCPGGSARER